MSLKDENEIAICRGIDLAIEEMIEGVDATPDTMRALGEVVKITLININRIAQALEDQL